MKMIDANDSKHLPVAECFDHLDRSGGAAHMIDISKREQFYQQEYCGCAFSLRDTNLHRMSQGRGPIKIGTQYYGRATNGQTSNGKTKV